jgi:hypothetical protein
LVSGRHDRGQLHGDKKKGGRQKNNPH